MNCVIGIVIGPYMYIHIVELHYTMKYVMQSKNDKKSVNKLWIGSQLVINLNYLSYFIGGHKGLVNLLQI